MNNVVVGYLPTPEGLAAIDYAIDATRRESAHLVIVNSGVRGNDADPSFASAADLDALIARLQSAQLSHEVRQPAQADSPAEQILSAADEVSANLIVIGLRRRSPIGKMFLGSTSQEILLDATCPVVAVKRPS